MSNTNQPNPVEQIKAAKSSWEVAKIVADATAFHKLADKALRRINRAAARRNAQLAEASK